MQRNSIQLFEWFKFVAFDLVFWTLAGVIMAALLFFFYQNTTALATGLVILKLSRFLVGRQIQKHAIEKYLNLKTALGPIPFDRLRKFMPFTFGVPKSSVQWKNKGIWGFSGPVLIAKLDPSLSDYQCTSMDLQIRGSIEHSSRANRYQENLSWIVGAGVLAICLSFYLDPEHRLVLLLATAAMIIPVWFAYESIDALNLMEYLEEVRKLNFFREGDSG